MINVRNIIFDLDGTLVDSSEGIVEAVNYSLQEMGEPPQPPEVIKTYIGYPLEKMYPAFTNAPIDQLRAHFRVKAAQAVVLSTRVLPGVNDTLQELSRRGYRMAIATTKIREHVKGIVEMLGWQNIFSAFTGSNDVERVKPDPAVFMLTLKKMGSRPADTLVVGDTENDVLAAKAVPIKIAAVASPYGGREKLKALQPDYFLERFSDLLDLLDHDSNDP